MVKLDYEVKIVTSKDLKHRSYLLVKVNGKRLKEYNGKSLGIHLKPNSAKSLKEKREILAELEFQFKKAIEIGTYPKCKSATESENEKTKTLIELLDIAISNKKKANLSEKYVLNLDAYTEKLKKFLTEDELNGHINDIQRSRIQEFMNLFNTSASHYMIARRHIKAVFAEINKTFEFNTSIVTNTDKRKATPTLHKVYSEEQLPLVFDFLKQNHSNLYLCCLMSYGCLLRPHNEIRLLKPHHFKNNITEIHLSGSENKGKKIRIVPIPNYVREILLEKTKHLTAEDNIFSGEATAYNLNYFSTAWKRMFKLMEKAGIIEKNQTIYSFRHTASVNVYKKTKDLHILQQLLGHSDMIVTLKYLRGLGIHNMDELKHVMPEL